jgi:ATP-dependent RNA helicase RhlB
LHINDLDLVVNYDLPADPEAYVHRIGRTARVGKKGKAITLVCERYVYGLEAIESLINIKIPVAFAEEAEYADDKSRGMRFHEEKRGRGPEKRTDRGGKPRYAERQKRPERPRHAERPQHAGKTGQTEKPRHIERPKHAEKPLVGRERAVAAIPGEADTRKRKMIRPAAEHSRRPERAVLPAGEPRHREEKKQQRKDTDRKQPVENRLDYYRKKYGEDFKPSTEPKKRKRTKLLDTIKGIFSRKKPAKKS